MTWQPAPIVFPDVEQVLTAFVRARLATRTEAFAKDVWVDNELPSTETLTQLRVTPVRFVAIRRDGGQESEVFDQPRVSVRCWAPNEADASDLAALVNALLKRAVDGKPIIRCSRQSGPLPVAKDGPLFQRYSLHEFTTRGVALT